MKQWLLALLVIVSYGNIYGQKRIEGFVFDLDSKKPIHNVEVFDDVSEQGTGDNERLNVVLTDSTGYFSITTNSSQLTLKHVSYSEYLIQTKGFENGTRIFMESADETMLNQTVIGADKIERALKNQIVSVEAVSPQLIHDKNPITIDEIVNQVSGVSISDGQINIRNGAGWSYGAGTRSLMVVDGMPLISGDAGSVQWNFIATENIRNMEVVKGASSVLYGSSALNGMINIRTAWPGQRPSTRVTAFTGNYNKPKREGLNWSDNSLKKNGIRFIDSRRIKKIDLTTTLEYVNDEGYRLGDFDKRLHAGLDIRRRVNNRFNYGVRGHLLKTENGSFLLWKSYDSAYNAFNDQTTTTNGTKFRIDPFLSYTTNKKWAHNFKGRLLSIDNQVDNGDTANNQSNSSKFFYFDYQSNLPIYKKMLKFVYGATIMSTTTKSPLFSGEQRANNQAVYAQLEFSSKRINTSMGSRYENYTLNEYEESKPVYRAGMNYKIAKGTYFRTSYGQGYRFPTIAESYIKTTVGLVSIYPNEQLESETGDNLEFGLKQGFKTKKIKGFFDVALFQMTYQNMMEFTFGQWSRDNSASNGYGLGFKSINTGETTIKGIDLSLVGEMKIKRGVLSLFGGYTYSLPTMDSSQFVFAKDSFNNELTYQSTSSDPTDNILKYRNVRSFKMDVSYKKNRFSIGLSTRYQSQIQNIDKAFVSDLFSILVPGIQTGLDLNPNGYWLVDTRISYRVTSKLKLAVVLNNIGNVEYMVRPADIGAPRSIIFQLGLRL